MNNSFTVGQELYYIKYGGYISPCVDIAKFEYYGDEGEIWCSITDTWRKESINISFIYNYNIFDSLDKAKQVIEHLNKANSICNSCEYEKFASEVCRCKTCAYYVTEKKSTIEWSEYCDKIYKITGKKVSIGGSDYPCKLFKPKNTNEPFVDYDSYMEAINNCDYNWCVDSKCKMYDYLINNKPDFYIRDGRHNYISDYKRPMQTIVMKIDDSHDYFSKRISYEDFANFSFIDENNDISFDKLYVGKTNNRNKKIKYDVVELN